MFLQGSFFSYSAIKNFLILAFVLAISACVSSSHEKLARLNSPSTHAIDPHAGDFIDSPEYPKLTDEIFFQTGSSVVQVEIVSIQGQNMGEAEYFGSGVIIEHQGDRFVLTNHHVVAPALNANSEHSKAIAITAIWEDVRGIENPVANSKDIYDNPKPFVKLVARHLTFVTPYIVLPEYDVAFLGPIRGNEHLVPAKMFNKSLARNYKETTPILIWSSPYGMGMVPLVGFACKHNRCYGTKGNILEGYFSNVQNLADLYDMIDRLIIDIYHDVISNPGQSGGPIFSLEGGLLIGINKGFSVFNYKETNPLLSKNQAIVNVGIPIQAFWDDFVKEYDARKLPVVHTSEIGRPSKDGTISIGCETCELPEVNDTGIGRPCKTCVP